MKSIRSKVYTAILLITLFTSLAVTFLFYRKSARMIEENYSSTLHSKNVRTVENLDEMLRNIYHININASCSPQLRTNLQAYLSHPDDAILEHCSEQLKIFSRQNTSISSIYLLIPEYRALAASEDYPACKKDIDEADIKAIIQTADKNAGPVLLDDLAHEDSVTLSFVETVTDKNQNTIGYILSNIDTHSLYYHYIAGIDDGMVKEAVLLNRENRVIASLEQSPVGNLYVRAETYQPWMAEKERTGIDRENLYSFYEAPFSQCRLFIIAEKSAVLENLIETRRYFFGVLIIFLILSLLPAFYLTNAIYRPLGRLTCAMHKVTQGDLDTRAEIVSKDEIGILAADFNQMLFRIQELIHQLLGEEKQRKDAELEALQYQITPHFMYNTLNAIKCSAILKGEQELGQIIGGFIELLQACINKKGAFLTVAEDIHILENYIRLQEFRYGSHFHVQYQIAPETRECLIPRLVLQPLVENALLHGIDIKTRDSRLVIISEAADDILYLKVKDNGRGMTQEQIDTLLNSKTPKTKGLTAVGIPNVRDRLRLYYGDRAGITYESGKDGTTAVICLPLSRSEF